jgi:Paraquat-inducible protein A
MGLAAALLVLLLLSGASSGEEASKNDDPLSAFLYSLVLPVGGPGEHFNFLDGLGSATIDPGGECRRFEVASVSARPSATSPGGTIDFPTVYASGIGAACTANFSWFLVEKSLSGKGTAHVVLGDTTAFGPWQMSFSQDAATGLPTGADVTQCKIEAVIKKLTFSGDSLTDELLRELEGAVKVYVQHAASSIVCGDLKAFIETNITSLLQDFARNAQPYLDPVQAVDIPAQVVPPPPAGFISLEANTVIETLDWAVNQLGGADGPFGANALVHRFFPDGRIDLDTPFVHFSVPVLDSGFTLAVSVPRVQLGELVDTFQTLTFAVPVSGLDLSSRAAFHRMKIAVQFTLRVLNSTSEEVRLVESGSLNLHLGKSEADALLHLVVNHKRLKNLGDLPWLIKDQPECILQCVDAIILPRLLWNAAVPNFFFNLTAGQLEYDVARVADSLISTALQTFPAAVSAGVAQFANNLFRTSANSQTQKVLEETRSSATCTNFEYYESSNPSLETFGIMSAAAAGILVLIFAWAFFVRRSLLRARSSAGSHAAGSDRSPLLPATFQHWAQGALIVDPDIPLAVRLVVPPILLLNAVVFLFSTFHVGAIIYIQLDFKGESFTFPPLFEFSLYNTTKDLYNAGTYWLFGLVMATSVCWPYVKLGMMILCWVMPLRILSFQSRERMLVLLDALGKWSLVDSFLLCVFIAGFYVKVFVPPASEDHPSDGLVITSYATTTFGYYLFLYATMFSLAVTHVLLWLHRRARQSAESTQRDSKQFSDDIGSSFISDVAPSFGTVNADVAERRALASTAFTMRGNSVRLSRCANILLLVLTACVVALLATGGLVKAYSFEFEGAAGAAITFLNQSSYREFSVIDVVTGLSSHAPPGYGLGAHFLEVVFLLLVFVLPIVHMLSLMVLWFAPLSAAVAHRVFVALEVLRAWACADTFVVAMMASLLQIGEFADFIQEQRCGFINPTLKKYFSEEMTGEDVCIFLGVKFLPGFFVLLAGAVLSWPIIFIVENGARRILHFDSAGTQDDARPFFLHRALLAARLLEQEPRVISL